MMGLLLNLFFFYLYRTRKIKNFFLLHVFFFLFDSRAQGTGFYAIFNRFSRYYFLLYGINFTCPQKVACGLLPGTLFCGRSSAYQEKIKTKKINNPGLLRLQGDDFTLSRVKSATQHSCVCWANCPFSRPE